MSEGLGKGIFTTLMLAGLFTIGARPTNNQVVTEVSKDLFERNSTRLETSYRNLALPLEDYKGDDFDFCKLSTDMRNHAGLILSVGTSEEIAKVEAQLVTLAHEFPGSGFETTLEELRSVVSLGETEG